MTYRSQHYLSEEGIEALKRLLVMVAITNDLIGTWHNLTTLSYELKKKKKKKSMRRCYRTCYVSYCLSCRKVGFFVCLWCDESIEMTCDGIDETFVTCQIMIAHSEKQCRFLWLSKRDLTVTATCLSSLISTLLPELYQGLLNWKIGFDFAA